VKEGEGSEGAGELLLN